jgi:hypothetical protein
MIYIDYFFYGLAALCVLGAPAILCIPYAILLVLIFRQMLTTTWAWAKVKVRRNSNG